MTLIEPMPEMRKTPITTTAVLVQWTIVQEGLWVGKTNGEFAGMIETALDGGYTAMSKFAGPLGTYPTINEAKLSFSPQ
ncbi:MAG: hypothetical protein ACOH19_15400 [Rhodoglobus sp.]